VKKLACLIEIYHEDGTTSEADMELSVDEVCEKIEWLSQGCSSDITIENGNARMTISLSGARASVFISDGSQFFDYSAGQGGAQCVDFVQGGQRVSIPSRHCVEIGLALEVVQDFFATDRLNLDDPSWERQPSVGRG
jgi:hypothetical protein